MLLFSIFRMSIREGNDKSHVGISGVPFVHMKIYSIPVYVLYWIAIILTILSHKKLCIDQLECIFPLQLMSPTE